MRLYREFTDQASLDVEYDPTLAVPEAAATMADWSLRSQRTLDRLEGRLGVRYGPTVEEHLYIFPAGSGAPVHIFLHGGYWRRFAARDFAWVAEPLVARGVTAVVVNYALCPTVSLSEIVRQTRAAIAWCHTHVGELGGDATRITLSGHSAGGHLVGMALATDWAGAYGLPAVPLRAALAVSGLFDLRPFPYTYLQPALQLTTREVLTLSPIDLEPQVAAPLTVAVGGVETAEFRRQSREFATSWGRHLNYCAYEEIAGADHFTVLDAIFSETSPWLDRLLLV
jgi:arylformamidase